MRIVALCLFFANCQRSTSAVQACTGACSVLPAPTITSVSGTSPLGASYIAGNGALLISGTHLDAVLSAHVFDRALNDLGALAMGSAEASSLQVSIGAPLAAAIASVANGEVTIVVDAGAAGKADAAVQILAGAPGAVGPPGDASSCIAPMALTQGSGTPTLTVENSSTSTPLALVVKGQTDLTGNGDASAVRLPIYTVHASIAVTVGSLLPAFTEAICGSTDIIIGGGCAVTDQVGGTTPTSIWKSCPSDPLYNCLLNFSGSNPSSQDVPPGSAWSCDTSPGTGVTSYTVTANAICLRSF